MALVISSLNRLPRAIKFMAVGGSGALLKLALMYLFTSIIGIYYLVSFILTFFIVVAFNFSLHNIWTFNDRKKRYTRIGHYALTSLLSLGLNTLLVYILVSHIGINYLVATVCAILVSFLFNYLLSNKLVWQEE